MKLSELDKFRAQMLADSNRVQEQSHEEALQQPTKQVKLTRDEMQLIEAYASHKAQIMRKNITHLQKQMQLHATHKQILALQTFTQRWDTYNSIINKLEQ